ncbi:MAG: hypothetical protein CVU11_01610 [Bacteroidetes bacterium HGW-Bacteroidetes-6]|nr:MAG: hypothetical protein CVU11_01610 [Bacteroidetes bacterium HGW-Bacteroidetes-6]
MNNKRLLRNLTVIAFASVFGMTILFSGCQGDDQLGLDLQPPGELLNAEKTDTFSIVAYSKKEDSVRTDETSQSIAGFYYDPVFGSIKASFCSQVRLSGVDVDFGDNPVIDSVILHLEYYSIYGNSKQNNRLTFDVYELQNSISVDSTYYSNSPIVAGQKLGSKTFIPNLKDSFYVGGIPLAPQLRIPLDKNFGKQIVDAAAMGLMSDNSTFESFFHGFCVIPSVQTMNGSLLSLDVMSVNSGLTIYYHNDTDTLDYSFAINQACGRYGHFDRSFIGAAPDFINQINGDTSLGNQNLYLLPLAGAKVFIKFPYLQSLNSDFSVVINRAELIIPVDENDITEPTFPRAASLSLANINDEGANAYLPDQIYGETTFGGKYDSDTKSYRFILTRYIQDLLTGGESDNGLNLMVSGASIYGNRVILNGPENTNPMRLEITYTLIN